jgi:hypothetical protein
MPYKKVTSILSCNSFRTDSDYIKLEGVKSLEPRTPQNGLAIDKLERLILSKYVNYKINRRDEYGRSIAQVWIENANINTIMKEFIRSIPQNRIYSSYPLLTR